MVTDQLKIRSGSEADVSMGAASRNLFRHEKALTFVIGGSLFATWPWYNVLNSPYLTGPIIGFSLDDFPIQADDQVSTIDASLAKNPQAHSHAPRSEKLPEVSIHGRTFSFREPLEVAVSLEHGIWNYSAENLSLLAYGDSPEEARQSFFEDFEMMWDSIGQSPDEVLTYGAQRVKQELLKLVKPEL